MMSGQSIFDEALTISLLRFRPILMTAVAFILGIFPLVIAAAAKHARKGWHPGSGASLGRFGEMEFADACLISAG